jgi:hypothetical protein
MTLDDIQRIETIALRESGKDISACVSIMPG